MRDYNKLFDIIIVGAGPVGWMCAAQCLKLGLRVCLLEKNSDPDLNPNFKSNSNNNSQFATRVSALSRASYQMFKDLDIWDLIADRACFYNTMWVSGQYISGDSMPDFKIKSEDIFEPSLGCIVENQMLCSALKQYCQKFSDSSDFSIQYNFDLESIENNNNWSVISTDHQIINGRFLIGAEGGNSKIRELNSINTQSKQYHQSAIVATLKLNQSHEFTARQIFTPDGPVALLPLFNQEYVSLVWSVKTGQTGQTGQTDHAEDLLNLSPEQFIERLNHIWKNNISIEKLNSERFVFPLKWQHAEKYIFKKGLLMGDAAHVIHPLAGQGVNLGFKDVLDWVNILKKALSKSRDFTTDHFLNQYESSRRLENKTYMHSMTMIQKLYGIESKYLKTLKHVFLKSLNKSKFLQILLAGYGLGK